MSPNNASITLRQAEPSDWPAVEALLLASRLPTEGAREHLPSYLLAESNGELVGSGGACAAFMSLPLHEASNLRSCGRVRPHGHRELAHPESGFYTVGVKSYGRAPTFLMATGFEQVRSVVAAIADDLAAAAESPR